MKQFYVYVHAKPNGDPFYVGKGCVSRRHTRAYEFKTGRNGHYQNIVAKYGRENILVYVFGCDSEQQAFDDERRWVYQLRSEGWQLTNASDGGEGGASGCKRSPETLAKMSAAQKGRTFSAESIMRMRKAIRPGNSPEACARQAETMRGNKFALGLKHTDETKAKISASCRGELSAQAKISEKDVLAIRAAYVPHEVTWLDLSRKYGVSRSQIGRIIKRESWAVVS